MKFNKKKGLFVLLLIVIIIIFIYKITSKNNENKNVQSYTSEEIVYQNTLRLGISNFDTINPLLTNNKEIININQLIYEPLLLLNTKYELELCLATEYAKTSEKTYIVKINDDIKWSNGTNLSAEDVKFTIDLLKSVNNIYSENVKNIYSVEAIDNSTIKINLNEEVYFFEYNLIFPIMCKSYYSGDDFFASTKYPIGTGKYKISSVTVNEIILEKNENYRNQNNENIEKIIVNIYNEIGEVYNSFKIGNIDIINTSSILYKDYVGTIGYYVKAYKGREYDFLSCNCNDNLLKEKSVRQAISFAIDKENIISTVYNNNYYTADYVLDFGSYIYNNSVNEEYNPEKAKEILTNNGWTYNNNTWKKDGKVLQLNLAVNSSNINRCEVANIIKTQLENIGIRVIVNQVSDSQYNSYLANKSYQLLLTGIYNGYSPDLNYFYGEGNISNYNNEQVNIILSDIKNITNQKLLQENYKNLVNITKEDCAYIGLYRNKNSMLISNNVVGNFEPNNYNIFYNFDSWNRE